ncbi:sporulation integral membrane protein YtvI [Alkalihalobacterium alkalinitrilicum]|uniref:sporulation integral membrane protein YtvI n=1 Tax=Alkalihalobacterium alkalinitrilicum TaxID=427920 RepID=UPI000994EA8D|nr:sporulation integral membrane protein YtvI [Alkalihalobacterium alkalinitrilicum]
MNKEQFTLTLRIIFVLMIILSIVISSYYVTSVTYPFIFGFILAFLINPLVNFLEFRWKLNRTIAVFVSLMLIFVVFSGLITLFIAEIISGSNHLATVLPYHINTLVLYLEGFFFTTLLPIYEQVIRSINSLEAEQQSTILNYIQTFSSQIATNAGSAVQKLFNGLSDFLLSLPNLATVFLFTLMATFFISKDWYKLTRFFRKSLPQKVIESSTKVLNDLKHALFGYMLGQLTLISITFVFVLSGLLILQVEYPFTIAVIIAIVDLIPYLGTGLIFIPWIIYSFFAGQLSLTIGLCVLYGIILIQRQLLEPKVLSSSIGVEPLAMLIALFVGFQLFGFLGLIIGPASLVFLNTIYKANVFHDIRDFVLQKKS